jgi:addiction module HigA family antidote
MHNPSHPGKYIVERYLVPNGISRRELSRHLDVSTSTVNRMLRGVSTIDAEMALRLSKVLGKSAESWLEMQRDDGFWHARQHLSRARASKLQSRAA